MSSRSGQSKDSRGTLAFNDSIASALSVIDEEHALVHDEAMFHFSTAGTLPANSDIGLRIVPDENDTDKGHFSFRVAKGGLIAADATIKVYTDATFTESGFPSASWNRNRATDSDVVPDWTFELTLPGTFGTGTLLCEEVLQPGRVWEPPEYILDPGQFESTDFFIQVINLNVSSSFVISFGVDFYIHPATTSLQPTP